MKTTVSQDRAFISDVISSSLLEDAIEHIVSNFEPQEIYSKDSLEAWAENNGYIKE